MHGCYQGTCDPGHSFAKIRPGGDRSTGPAVPLHGNLIAVQQVSAGYCVSHSRPPVRILRPAGIGTLVSEVSLWMTMLPFPVTWNVSAMNEVHGEGANASAVPVTVTSCFGRYTTPSK